MNRGAAYGILGDLNSFGAAQDYLNVSKTSKKWVNAALYLCSAQALLGACLFFLDSIMVFDVTAKVLGQLVAVVMIAIGACGAYGSHKKSRNLLNVHIVGIIIAVMLGVQYISAFSRDNYVNCSMARLYIRTKKIQGHLEKQPAVNMFTHVVARLNEMEDMLHMVEEGSVENLQKKLDSEKTMSSDANYVKYKLQLLKVHAERMLKHHAKVDDEEEEKMSEKERQELNNRIDAASEILDRVQQHSEDGEMVTFEEYEDLLGSLAAAYEGVSEGQYRTLNDHIKQLAFDKDIFKRQEQGYKDTEIDVRRKKRHERQIEWSKRMQQAMRDHAFQGAQADLEDLPQWCLQDRSYNKALALIGTFLVFLQLASGFCVLSLSFHLPVKGE